jgi:hypothetical protein
MAEHSTRIAFVVVGFGVAKINRVDDYVPVVEHLLVFQCIVGSIVRAQNVSRVVKSYF